MTTQAELTMSAGESETEQFQPVPVVAPTSRGWLFNARCVVDLQLGSIVKHLRPQLSQMTGDVLDVGAGESPWRVWLPENSKYHGIDVAHSDAFGMASDRQDIVYFDGLNIPYQDNTFDNVLCIEVLEHSVEPERLLHEMARVLRPSGQLVLTVPWSARRHHIPHDYHRFSKDALARMLNKTGFATFVIRERGTDIGVIANKLTVLAIRLVRPPKLRDLWFTLPLALFVAPSAAGFILAAHCADALHFGSKLDPLGYFVKATKEKISDSQQGHKLDNIRANALN